MKILTTITLLLLLNICCTPTKPLGGTYQFFAWSQYKPLQYQDFKSNPKPITTCQLGSCFVRILPVGQGDEHAALFLPENSWLAEQTKECLTHQQYHYNIAELYTRMYRKEVTENKIDSLWYIYDIKDILPNYLLKEELRLLKFPQKNYFRL